MLHSDVSRPLAHRPTASTAYVADRLGLKVTTVCKYIREHLLEAARIGRANRVYLDSVERLERINTKAARLHLRYQSEARQRDGVDLEGDAKLTAIRAAELAERAKQRLSSTRGKDLVALDAEENRRGQLQQDADQKLEAFSDMERMRVQGRIGADLVHKSVGEMNDLELIRLSSALQRALSSVGTDRATPPPPPLPSFSPQDLKRLLG